MSERWKQAKKTVLECIGFDCDKCGASYQEGDIVEIQERVSISDVGGYGSVWGDGVLWKVVICQRCAHDIFKDVAKTRNTND